MLQASLILVACVLRSALALSGVREKQGIVITEILPLADISLPSSSATHEAISSALSE